MEVFFLCSLIMIDIDDDLFLDIVNEAFLSIPERFRNEMENVDIKVVDKPSASQLKRLNVGGLFGLFEGVPKTALGQTYFGVQPSKITIFKDPLVKYAKDLDVLKIKVRQVLMHEVAHYFGYSEDDMTVLDERFVRRYFE